MPEDSDASNETPRLTSKQRAHLRSLAHDNETVVRIGKDGLSDAVLTSIEEAFNTRELVKIRILDNANEQPRDMAHAIADRLDNVQVVHTLGWTVTLYRPDPDEPKIELP